MAEEIKLHTARLIVRIPRVEDAQNVFTLMKDKDTAMITGFTPMSNISEAEGKTAKISLRIIEICILGKYFFACLQAHRTNGS